MPVMINLSLLTGSDTIIRFLSEIAAMRDRLLVAPGALLAQEVTGLSVLTRRGETTVGCAAASVLRDILSRWRGKPVADIKEPCLTWRTSSASNSTACVEVAVLDRLVLVRDSMNQTGPVLHLAPTAWSAFLVRARSRDASFRRA